MIAKNTGATPNGSPLPLDDLLVGSQEGHSCEAELKAPQQTGIALPEPQVTYLELQSEYPQPDPDYSFTVSAPVSGLETLTFVHQTTEPAAFAVGPHMQVSQELAPEMVSLSLETQKQPVEPIEESRKTVLGWLASRVKLYGAAELAGSVTAAVGIGLTGLLYPNSAAVGIIGTMSENLGLYSILLYCAMRDANRSLEEQGKSHTWQTRTGVIRNLFLQFGIAEGFDSLLIRPALMGSGGALGYYLGEHLLGQGSFAMATGALGCKIVADVIYWTIVEATGAALHKTQQKK